MSSHKVRIVVIVRCPLCGSWIVGNDYSGHLESIHLRGVEPVWEALADALPVSHSEEDLAELGRAPEVAEALREGLSNLRRLRDSDGNELTPSKAGLLLSELGRRWSEGQDASLGFQIYE